MLDRSLPYKSLYMRRPEALPLPPLPTLPGGFFARAFQPGDEAHWARIERSVGEFPTVPEALAYFTEHYLPHAGFLAQRCCFIAAPDGLPVATDTAWRQGEAHALHWVACDPAYQGRGLGRAAVVHALHRFAGVVPPPIWLHTQTWSHRAVRLYHDLGFRLVRRGALPYGTENEYDEGMAILGAVYPPEIFAQLAGASQEN
ncbi:MAG: GNAT family N-acetyltransferase [Candidatus Spyradocola sp.]|jgi:ribosomal protein S18 acetylase RimI-like enzyme